MRASIILTGLIVIISCKQTKQQQNLVSDYYDTVQKGYQLNIPDTNLMGNPIFSNMNLNVKLTDFFNTTGDNYKGELLHSIKKSDTYLSSQARSLNLGVYAVDFNYTRIYGQLQESEHYLNTILNLGSSLGIPNDFIEISIEKLEHTIMHADTFAMIASDIYIKAKEYFTENDNEYNVLLILIGGMTETLFIAVNLPDDAMEEMRTYDVIYQQKASLEALIKYAEVTSENELVSDIMGYLNRLNDTLVDAQSLNEIDKQIAFEATKATVYQLRTYITEIP